MIKKLYRATALIIILAFIVTGCSTSPKETKSKNNGDQDSKYVQALKNTKQIEIKENLISIGKKYTLYVDGKEVGEVTGKFINVFGDTFTMKDKSGRVLATEKQIKRWNIKFNRNAVVYDAAGNITGYIGEETLTKIFSIGYYFHFFDKDKNSIGISDQVNLSLLKKNVFENSDGSKAYTVNKEFSLIRDVYKLKVEDSSKIPLYQAIFMVCIEDAIKDSKEKKKKKK